MKGKGTIFMMDYREFVDQVTEDLNAHLPEELSGARVFARDVEKLQGTSYYGITVQPENSSIGVSLDLKPVYQMMEEEGLDYDGALDRIANTVENGILHRPEITVDEISDYEHMKDSLMIQLVPTAGNEEMLSSMPHVEKEDMSIVYRMVIDTNTQGMASTLVTNQMLDTYGITADQLHADALANASVNFPAEVRSMREMMAEMTGLDPDMLPDDPGMYVATCNHGMNGAGCIFYPEFMDQTAEKVGGDFFILPSSIHEVILVPDNGTMTAQELDAMVQEVNANEVIPEERLSGNAFHYDSKDHVFEKAASYETRMQEKEKSLSKGKDRAKEKTSIMDKLDAKKKEAKALDSGKKPVHKSKEAEI